MKNSNQIKSLLADKMQVETSFSRGFVLSKMTTQHRMHGDVAYIYAHLRDGCRDLKRNSLGKIIEVSVSEYEAVQVRRK